MAEKDILVPDVGDFADVEIIEVLVSAGDSVEAEDSLITLESDKASMEIPSPFAGTIKKLNVNVGDRVSQGAVIGVIETAGADDTPAQADDTDGKADAELPPAQAKAETAPVASSKRAIGEKPPQAPPIVPSSVESGRLPHASPSVRRFARELGADLSRVRGSGSKGRILKEDVQEFVKGVMTGASDSVGTGPGLPAVPAIDFSKFGETEVQPLGRIQKISGKHLHASWLNVPHVTQFDEADITELEAFRKSQKAEAEKRGLKVTFMPFLMKALAAAMREMPKFNSSLSADGESLILKRYINIGVAVDTPNGLVVPVFNAVDEKSVFELSAELMDVSSRARDGKLLPADMQGGCLTISSLGGIGGTQFTPIVNAPEVAILGVSRAAMKPVWDGHAFQPRLTMPFSLSYDHRVIDGAEGVRFTTYLAALLGDIRKLLL